MDENGIRRWYRVESRPPDFQYVECLLYHYEDNQAVHKSLGELYGVKVAENDEKSKKLSGELQLTCAINNAFPSTRIRCDICKPHPTNPQS